MFPRHSKASAHNGFCNAFARNLVCFFSYGSYGRHRLMLALFAGLLLLPAMAHADATLSAPSVDYDGSFTVSWYVYGGTGYSGYTVLMQRFNGGSWTNPTSGSKPLGSQSYPITVTQSGTYEYRVDYGYCKPYVGGCPMTTGSTAIKTTVVTFPPNPPNSVSITPVNACSTSLPVKWVAASGYPSGSTKYFYLEESKNGGTWTSKLSGTTATQWTNPSVTEGATYRYRVRTRYLLSGEYSAYTGYTYSSTYNFPYCPPGSVTNMLVEQLNPDTSSTSVRVSWGPASGVVLGYHVQRRQSGQSWPVGYDCNGSLYSCEYADPVRGQQYEYRVRAYKDGVQGSWTTIAHTVLYAQPSPPSQPTFTLVQPYSYTVNWNNVGDANTGSITHKLWEKIGSQAGTWTTVGGVTSKPYNSGRTPVTTYQYKVQACNGNATPQCAESAVSSISFPGTPGPVTIGSISNAGRNYTLSWTAAAGDVTSYELRQSIDGGQNWSLVPSQDGVPTGETISNATVGIGYQYKVRACNSLACGEYTTIQTYWVPQTPANLGGSADPNVPSLTINWTGNSQADHYELQQSTDGGSSWDPAVSVSSTSYSPAGETNGTDYTYRVSACNSQGACSPYTGAMTIRLPYAIPASPAAPTINVNSSAGTLNASWAAVSGYVETYKVEQSTDGTNWTQVQNTNAFSYAPAGLAGGVTYHLRVSACHVDGCSDPGTAASAYLPHATPPLPDLTSTGGQIDTNIYGAGWSGDYAINWASGGGVVDTITVEEQEPGGTWQAASLTADVCNTGQCNYDKPLNYSGDTLSYRYRAQACNTDNCSGWKEIVVQVNAYLLPGVPASFTVSQGPTTAGDYTLRWTRPAGTEEVHYYYLDNADTPTDPDFPAITHDDNQPYFEQIFTGGQSGETYHYRVRACFQDDNGCDTYTAPLAVYIPYPAPNQTGPLTHTNFDPQTGSYTLSWTAAGGQVNDYELQRLLDDGQWVAETTTTQTDYAVSGQPNGETRSYRVRACNADNCGDYTDTHAVYIPHLQPGVPTGLYEQSMNPAQQRLTLAWNPPVSGGKVQSYEIETSTDSGANWQALGDTASQTFTATGLINGTTYDFRVRACNVDACSDYGTTIQVYLSYAAPDVPGAVTHNSGENSPAAGAFTVYWTAPAVIDAAVSPVSYYKVDYSANGGAIWQAAPTGGTTPGQVDVSGVIAGAPASATLTGLATGAPYSIRVRACNADGCGMNTTSYQVYLPHPAPGMPAVAPTVPSIEDNAVRRFTVQWTASPTGTIHHYQLEAYAGEIGTLDTWVIVAETPATAYTFTDRAYGQVYRYRVRACSEAQSSATSCSVWAVTEDIRLKYPTPNKPSGVTVSNLNQAGGNYTLGWNGVLGWAPQYRYELQENGQPLAELTDPAHELAISGRAPGTYLYRIRACNPAPDSDCGAWSSEASVTILPTPTMPGSLMVDNADGQSCQFNVAWTPPTGGLGTYHYELAVKINSGSWTSLAWTTGTSHNMIVNHNNDGDTHTFRVRARTYSNGQYSPWGTWRSASASTSCDYSKSDSYYQLYVAAPKYSESGQYTVVLQYSGSYAPGFKQRYDESTDGGGSWSALTNFGYTGVTSGQAVYDASSARPTNRYSYRIATCDYDLTYNDNSSIDCPTVVGTYWRTLTASTIVLRDPGGVGQVTIAGSPSIIDGEYIIPGGQFTLNWDPAPNPPGPATHKYEVQYKPAGSTGADAWMQYAEQTTADKTITLTEFGVAYDFRVRACAHLDGYVNCDSWSQLQYPVKRFIGAPRFPVNTYPDDNKLVIYSRRVPLQWLPPLNMPGSGIDHYEISVRSRQPDDAAGNEVWYGPDVLETVAHDSSQSEQQAMVEVEQGGQKEFMIRACGGSSSASCGAALIFPITVIVPPDPPEAPAGIVGQADPDYGLGEAFNGALSGEFTVMPSGAASYTLPVIVPPGTAGMQPEISLNYSSQAGNGIAGWGWSIGGLSAISRCNKTLAQDGEIRGIDYSDNDAWCLDGQRLIHIGGEQYRTEINTFSRIDRISGGDCGTWFEVETQDGKTLEYGKTDDACANSGWALNKVTDVSGNIMLYKYEDVESGAFVIDRIEYGGDENDPNPYTAVDFHYDSVRPDPIQGYRGGRLIQQTQRLTRITTGVNPTDMTQPPAGYGVYTLNYQDDGDFISLLASIDYCATVGGEEICMKSLNFQWSPAEPGWEKLTGYNPPRPFAAEYPNAGQDQGARLADLNNDGLPDLLYAPDAYNRVAYRNTGSGWQHWGEAYKPPVDFVDNEGKDLGVRLIDITNDGLPELLTSESNGAGGYDVYEISGNSWSLNPSLALPASFIVYQTIFGESFPEPGTDNGLRPVDLNSDGLVDLVYGGPDGTRQAWRNTGSSTNRWQSWTGYVPPVGFSAKRATLTGWPVNPPQGFEDKAYDTTAWLADFTGDGLPDLLYKSVPHIQISGTNQELIRYRMYTNTGAGWSGEPNSYLLDAPLDYGTHGPDLGIRLADLNGDGLPDLVRGNHYTDQLRYATGSNWSTTPFESAPEFHFPGGGILILPKSTYLLDLNHDGRTDVLTARSEAEGWLSTEAGWQENSGYGSPIPLDSAASRVADFNGDGRIDILYSTGSGKAAWTQRSGRRHITAVIDGLDNTTAIKYQAVTDQHLNGRDHALYTPSAGPLQADEREASAPMQVVSQVTVNDGIGGELTTEYAYKGLTASMLQGRGMQGFEEVIAYKPDGTVAATRYARRFPYTGMPLEVKVTYGEGPTAPVIEKTTHEYCYAVTSQALAGSMANPETPGFSSVNGTCGSYDDAGRHNESVFVFAKQTTAINNRLNDSLSAITASVTTVTDNTYSAFGYASRIFSTTTGDGNTYTAETLHDYYGSPSDWLWRGRVRETVTTHQVNGQNDGNNTRTTQYFYNSLGLLEREVAEPNDPALTQSVAYAYDQYGNTVETTVCEGGACQANSAIPNKDAPGRSTTTEYDAQGRYPVSSSNALDHTETYAHDHPLGLRTQLIGPNGLQTTWTYDALGRKRSETTPFGTTTFDYRKTNGGYVPGARYSVQESPPAGALTRVYYDGKGRKRRTLTQSLHGEWVAADIEYDSFGRVGRESKPYFVYTTTDGDAFWTETDYDGLGRIAQVRVPLGDIDSDGVNDGVAVTASDYLGFEAVVTDAKGRQKLTRKNALDQTVRVVDDYGGLNIEVDYTYDSQGNLETTTVDNNPATTVTVQFDKQGNKLNMTDPDMGYWEYEYNGYGELVRQEDARGNVTEIDYDKLGRMTERRETPAGGTLQTSHFTYDTAAGAGIGKPHVETGPHGDVKTYSYTARGQLEETRYQLAAQGWSEEFTVSRSYDTFGRAQLIYYPQVGDQRKVVENRYSPYGGLWYVLDIGDEIETGDESVYWIAEMVDARGQIMQETLRNQNTINNQFNAATGWLQKVESWDKDLNMIQRTRYEFDAVGNVQVRERFRPWIVNPDGTFYAGSDEAVAESFTYDSLDRLLTETLSRDGVQESFRQNGYDDLGNLVYKGDSGNNYTYNTCNAGPHAVCQIAGGSAGGTSFVYDANGNLTQSTSRTIEYSAFNKPTRITENGATVDFVYGADRARVFKRSITATGETQITWYVGLGSEGKPIYEQTATLDAGGQIAKREHLYFIYAGGYHGGQPFAVHVQEELEDNNPSQPNFIRYNGTEYYHRDHLGSVIAITGDTGVVEETRLLSFDAWGKRRNPDWSEATGGTDQYTLNGMRGNLAYTGHEAIPEVGLIHMNGRVYDPALGRFLSADPNVQFAEDGQSYNRYSYVRNNPLRYNDPSGYFLGAIFEDISPNLASFINIALNFIPGCQGWCSLAFNAAYAAANGASFGDIFASGMIGFFVSGFSGMIGHAIGGAQWIQTAVSGAFGGGVNAAIYGGNVRRGMVQGAAMAVLMMKMREATGALQPEGVESNSDLQGGGKEPVGISDEISANSLLDNATPVVGENGEKTLLLKATIANGGVKNHTFKGVIKSIKKYMNATRELDGETYTLKVELTETTDLLYADITVLDAKAAGYLDHRVDWFGGRLIYIRQGYMTKYTGAHEFGHLLGMHHQSNSSKLIMSYAWKRSLNGYRIQSLYEAYSRGLKSYNPAWQHQVNY